MCLTDEFTKIISLYVDLYMSKHVNVEFMNYLVKMLFVGKIVFRSL